jgi:hypothetical protein
MGFNIGLGTPDILGSDIIRNEGEREGEILSSFLFGFYDFVICPVCTIWTISRVCPIDNAPDSLFPFTADNEVRM